MVHEPYLAYHLFFYVVCELRMVFYILKWSEKNQKNILGHIKNCTKFKFQSTKFYCNTVILIHTVHGYFHATMAELSHYDGDHMGWKYLLYLLYAEDWSFAEKACWLLI